MVDLSYLGIIPDIVFYSILVSAGIFFLARRQMKRLSFEKKAVIFIFATIGLRLFFFFTSTQNEFPTGEVYYAVVPALQHPYLFPWEAPYGVLWYAITSVGTWLLNPLITMLGTSCPGGCTTNITYLNGTIISVPYTTQQWNLGLSMMTWYTLMSLPFYWFLRKSALLVGFFITDNFFWATTPVNVPILLFAIMGMFAKKYVPWAVIAKLPFGAPIAVWQYALGSASTPGHWFPHVMYGLWWVAAIVRWLPWKHSWNFRPDSMEIQLLNSQREKTASLN